MRRAHAIGDWTFASSAMREVITSLSRAARSDVEILLCGETGTGKEMAALEIHRRSRRRQGPFMVLERAEPGVAASQLRGTADGSKGSAREAEPGLLENASGGTLFVDASDMLSLDAQAILLRALERRIVRRQGDDRERIVDVRVIAATRNDLGRLVANGRFRDDLFFRIAEIVIELPPLRVRPDDVVPLAEAFLEELDQGGRTKRSLSPSAQSVLEAHAWPGNARELRAAVRRAHSLADGAVIEPAHLALTRNLAPDLRIDPWLALPLAEARREFERWYSLAVWRVVTGT